MSPYTDWAGTLHLPAGPAPRIASLVPSLTETLFALGLGAKVVARTGFCVHPRDTVRTVAKIGGTKDPDLSRLRQLAPTHLVVNIDENRVETVDEARTFIPHIVVTHPASPADNLRLYELLGAIFERQAECTALCHRFREACAFVARECAGLPREQVLYLIWRKPWMSVAHDTYIAKVLAEVGWDVVDPASDGRYPELSEADDAWRNAQRILVSTEPFAFRMRDVEELAARNRRPAHLIDGEWTSWYGVRAIEGLFELARFRRNVAHGGT